MRKVLLGLCLLLSVSSKTQSLCLQTFCKAWPSVAGDTAELEAVLTTSKGYKFITFTQASGPNTAVVTYQSPILAGTLAGTQTASVTGLVKGVYIFNIEAMDAAGGSVTGVDSIVVAAATPCPVIPGPPTFSGITVTLFGVPIVIPAGQGTKITFSYNNTTQTVTF